MVEHEPAEGKHGGALVVKVPHQPEADKKHEPVGGRRDDQPAVGAVEPQDAQSGDQEGVERGLGDEGRRDGALRVETRLVEAQRRLGDPPAGEDVPRHVDVIHRIG